jgi:hypothetical protein
MSKKSVKNSVASVSEKIITKYAGDDKFKLLDVPLTERHPISEYGDKETSDLAKNMRGVERRTERLDSLISSRELLKHYVSDRAARDAAYDVLTKMIKEEMQNPQPIGKIE